MQADSRAGTMPALIALVVLLTSSAVSHAEPPAKQLLALHQSEAASYRMWLDEARQQLLELQPQPIFSWTNVTREQQIGHVFVWMAAGRPQAIGTIFSVHDSSNGASRRALVHEFVTLAEEPLVVETPAASRYQWEPKAGITMTPIPRAPAVGATKAARLLQMKALARAVTARTISGEKQTDELRLLPQPLLRYTPEKGPVVDGALFAMVGTAGTDPELLVLIEAHRAQAGRAADQSQGESVEAPAVWMCSALRFSDRELTVEVSEQPLWSSVSDDAQKISIENNWTLMRNPLQTYMCYRSREIPELDDEPAQDDPSSAAGTSGAAGGTNKQ